MRIRFFLLLTYLIFQIQLHNEHTNLNKPNDVTIKQEEIQEISEDADLADEKWWFDNIDGIIEMFKPYDY
ncbi:hypothetical protein Hanom_Chr08g00716731 [Helianthus anomalus]